MPATLPEELRLGILPWLARVPPPFEDNNYQSVFLGLEESVGEFERAVQAGKLEGPLGYRPHLIMPLGLVVKTIFLTGETKLRLVIDGTRTGLNDGLLRLAVSYDTLAEALLQVEDTYRWTKLDLTDAFWAWALNPLLADLYGVRHPTTGAYYRWRSLFSAWPSRPSSSSE